MLRAGYALVTVAEDLNPDHGNVIRRGSGMLVPAHAGNMVERSPNTIYRDEESGYAFEYPPNSTQMFLPDGRLVDRTPGAAGFDGALSGPLDVPLPALMVGGGVVFAAIAGAMAARRGRRGKGALIGAVLGTVGLAGAAFGPWLYQKIARPAAAGTVAA